jgi:hypothetical protein
MMSLLSEPDPCAIKGLYQGQAAEQRARGEQEKLFYAPKAN